MSVIERNRIIRYYHPTITLIKMPFMDTASSSSTASLSSPLFYWSSFVVFITLLISLVIRVGPFSTECYRGTQMIPHPHPSQLRSYNTSYAIVFDGGSTGTRIHIFSFGSQNEGKTRRVYLDKEVFHYIKPGLSSYSINATEAAVSLQPLLDKAMNVVPDDKAIETCMILKATAGLRLLPERTSELILQSVREKLFSLPYKVDANAVSILDGRDEGIFAWYTVNFLMGKLHNITSSIVTLDLGGGSTQITFATNNTETLVRSPNNFIVKRNIEGEPEYLYTHSYLGYGLMSARNTILTADMNYITVDDDDDDDDNDGDENIIHIQHPCFAYLTNTTHEWAFGNNNYHITGDKSADSFERCYNIAKQFVSNAIHAPEELKTREIYALSYYYDRLKDVKVIKENEVYNVVKVKDYYRTAEHICKSIIKMKNQSPFLCIDLTYIAALLHDGFGFNWQKEITFIKKINGIETSWALGAAINLLNFYDNNNDNDNDL